jgi:hypothetical protein
LYRDLNFSSNLPIEPSVVVFLIFLASFAILEFILWRADAAKRHRDLPAEDATTSMVALAKSLDAEGRGVAPGVRENTTADTLK